MPDVNGIPVISFTTSSNVTMYYDNQVTALTQAIAVSEKIGDFYRIPVRFARALTSGSNDFITETPMFFIGHGNVIRSSSDEGNFQYVENFSSNKIYYDYSKECLMIYKDILEYDNSQVAIDEVKIDNFTLGTSYVNPSSTNSVAKTNAFTLIIQPVYIA